MELQFKEKSKRGRKPKKFHSEEKQIIKEVIKNNKRGRKPKPKHPLELLLKLPKKRGRKPKDKYGLIKENNYENTNLINKDNIILHLPIHSSQITENDFFEQSLLEYNPDLSIPIPYEKSIDFLHFENISDSISEKELIENNTEIKNNIEMNNNSNNTSNDTKDEDTSLEIQTRKMNLKYVGENIFYDNQQDELMVSEYSENNFEIHMSNNINKNIYDTMIPFKESNKQKAWPQKTDIYCWWCCSPFNNTPYALPIKKNGNEYLVKGCFCSPECAASWNFDNQDNDNKWENYSLLNILYTKVFKGVPFNIKLAPPKECLKIFGGHLTIEEFRKNNINYDIEHKLVMPPVISLIPQIEESNNNLFFDKNIPLDDKRIDRANKELKLKREKPLINKMNTLEDCMKLKYI